MAADYLTSYQSGALTYSVWSNGHASVVYDERYAAYESVSIPATIDYAGNTYVVDSISPSAFTKCLSLKSVQLSDNLAYIGKQAFRDCRALTSFTLPGTVREVASEAFLWCSGLRTVVIESGLSTISNGMFKSCGNLEEVTIPNSVSTISKEAFSGCNKIKKFYSLTTSVTVSPEAFGSTSLANAQLFAFLALDVTDYPWNTFGSIVILDNLDFFVDGLYYNIINDYEAEVTDDQNSEYNKYTSGEKIEKYNGSEIEIPRDVYIEQRGQYYRVARIGEGAFKNHANITMVTIADNVEVIGESAFEGTSIANIELPYSVHTIGAGAFRQCSKLKAITFPNREFQIYDEAFRDCAVLSSLTLPTGLSFLGDGAFYGCTSLRSVAIPAGVESIGNSAFYHCDLLSAVTLPAGINSIGAFAFAYCQQLPAISLPDGVTTLGEQAFRDCQRLTDVTLPASIKHIGAEAFRYCRSIVWLTFPEQLQTIGRAAFANCSGLKALSLPSQLTTLDDYAFASCNQVTAVSISEQVGTIGKYAFQGCSKLADIYCKTMAAPAADQNSFDATTYQQAVLHVQQSATGYDAEPWSAFTTRQTAEFKKYRLTYYVDGSTYQTYEQETATPLVPLATPINGGREFSGWSTVNKQYYGEGTVPTLMPDHDVSVYGYFRYNATFVVDGQELLTKAYFYDQHIEQPESTREGYSISWRSAPSTMPNRDIYIYGDYVKNRYWVYFYVEDQKWYEQELEYQAEIIEPTDYPQKEGYAFEWGAHPQYMPAENLYIWGHYIPQVVESDITFRINTNDSCAVVVGYNNKNYRGVIDIPSRVTHENTTYPVTGIQAEAFLRCQYVTGVNLPDSLCFIGKQAFRDCNALTAIDLPASIERLDEEVFLYCTLLADVYCRRPTVPNAKASTFKNTPYETTTILHVPAEGLDAYRAIAPWSQFKNITDIKLSKLTYMLDGQQYRQFTRTEGDVLTLLPDPEDGDRVFSGWSELPATMPDHDVTVTGNFMYTVSFRFEGNRIQPEDHFTGEPITPPAIIEKEGHSAVWDNMPEVMPPHDITVTGHYVINQYTVTYIVEGQTVSEQTLDYGTPLEPPTVPERFAHVFAWNAYPATMPAYDLTIEGHYSERIVDVTTAGVTYRVFMLQERAEVVANANSATGTYEGELVVLPEIDFEEQTYSVLSIAANALSGSKRLTRITLPEGLQTLGKQAFRDCQSLKDIELPASITTIGDECFMWCTALTTMTCHNPAVPQTAESVFLHTNTGQATLYVPAESLELYAASVPWSGFGQILPLESDGIRLFRAASPESAFYTLDGRRTDRLYHGHTYVEHRSDGTSRKIYVK